MVADGYRPDRWDVIGALVCLAEMAVIMYAPRNLWSSAMVFSFVKSSVRNERVDARRGRPA